MEPRARKTIPINSLQPLVYTESAIREIRSLFSLWFVCSPSSNAAKSQTTKQRERKRERESSPPFARTDNATDSNHDWANR